MALQGEGQISFSNIAGELGSSTPYSLRGMSDFAGFGTPDTVSEFYGYDAGGGGGGTTLTQFFITDVYGDPREACFLSCEIAAWHSGTMEFPGIGDFVYYDENGTVPIDAGFYGFYYAKGGPAKNTMSVSKAGNGEVLNTYQC